MAVHRPLSWVAGQVSFWLPWTCLALLGAATEFAGMGQRFQGLRWLPVTVGVVGLLAAGVAWLSGRRTGPGAGRGVILGLLSNGTLLCMAALGLFTASGGRQVQEVATRQVHQMVSQSAEAAGGWYGLLSGPDYTVAATQIDRGSRAGRVFAASFESPFTLLIFSVDNRGGHGDLDLDLSGLKVQLADGSSHAALPRQQVLSSAVRMKEGFLQKHGQPYHVPRGQAVSSALAFLAPDERMEQVAGLVVRLNGKEAVIHGRYLSARDKEALRRRR